MTVALAHSAVPHARSATALVRQPIFLVLTLIQPMVWLLLFGAALQVGRGHPRLRRDGTYLEFLTPGVVADDRALLGGLGRHGLHRRHASAG